MRTSEKPVYCVDFSPVADQVAAGGADGVVRLWDASTGEELRRWTTGANIIHQVVFDPTGKRIYVAESRATAGMVRGGLWWASIDSDEIHDQQDVDFPARGMVALGPNRVLIGDGDGTLRLTDGRLLPAPQVVPFRHRSNVLALAYSPAAGRIVTGSGDNTMAILRTSDFSLMLQVPGEDAQDGVDASGGAYAASVTADGKYAVFGSDHGRIQVIPLASDVLTERACRLAGNPATAEELGLTPDELAQLEMPC